MRMSKDNSRRQRQAQEEGETETKQGSKRPSKAQKRGKNLPALFGDANTLGEKSGQGKHPTTEQDDKSKFNLGFNQFNGHI